MRIVLLAAAAAFVLGLANLPASAEAPKNALSKVVHSTDGKIHLVNPGSMRGPITNPQSVAAYGKQANESYLRARQLAKEGKRCEALRQYSNAVTIRERIWGDKDPAIVELLKQQAELYRVHGQWHECEMNYRKILAIYVKRYGPGSKENDSIIAILADLCERQCDNTDALSFYQQLVAIRQRYDAPNSQGLKQARLKLATRLAVTFDYPAAEEILKQAIAEEEASPKPDKAYLAKVLDAYGGVLRESYRTDEAHRVEARQRALQMGDGSSLPGPAVAAVNLKTNALIAHPSTTP